MYSLFLVNFCFCYQLMLSLWSLSHFAPTTPNWLKSSLLSSMLTFFPSWILLRLACLKFLSHWLLQQTLSYWHVSIHRSMIQPLFVSMSENIHMPLYEWFPNSSGNCHHISASPGFIQKYKKGKIDLENQELIERRGSFIRWTFFFICLGFLWGKKTHSNK